MPSYLHLIISCETDYYKGEPIPTRSLLFRFLFLIVTRATWEYSFSSVLLSGLQAVIIKYVKYAK